MKIMQFRGWVLVVCLLVLAGLGCAQKSPEERVEVLRSRYTARLNGFVARSVLPQVLPPSEADAEMDEGASESLEDAVPEPTGHQVLLDIVVQHDSSQKLPGLTLDITMGGADGTVKGQWPLWVDTAELEKGTMLQVSHTVEVDDFVDGVDGFNVEVRSPVPPEERSRYREFSAAQ